jgi:hypothetical protein
MLRKQVSLDELDGNSPKKEAAALETRLRQAQAESMAPWDLISCLVADELTRRRKQAELPPLLASPSYPLVGAGVWLPVEQSHHSNPANLFRSATDEHSSGTPGTWRH